MRDQQREVLESVYEYLPRFKDGINELAKNLAIRVTAKEREVIVQVVDGLQWLLDAFRLTKEIQTTEIDTQLVRPLIVEMCDAIENDDMILLGDLLEYELTPIVENWEEQVHVLVG